MIETSQYRSDTRTAWTLAEDRAVEAHCALHGRRGLDELARSLDRTRAAVLARVRIIAPHVVPDWPKSLSKLERYFGLDRRPILDAAAALGLNLESQSLRAPSSRMFRITEEQARQIRAELERMGKL